MSKNKTSKPKVQPKTYTYEKTVHYTYTFFATSAKSAKAVVQELRNEDFDEADEFCPNCDNHFMPEAKTPETEGHIVIGFEAKKGHENKVMIDEREKQRQKVLMEDIDDVDWDKY